MKPKTKLQKQVAGLSSMLPAITGKQITWATKNTVTHVGFKTKKQILCTECGESFPHTEKMKDGKHIVCPRCGQELKIENSRKRTDREMEYFCIITTRQGFQVIRYFYIERSSKAGEKANYFIDEVFQRWLLPDGRFETIAKVRLMNSAYIIDMWSHGSELEIRSNDNDAYYIHVKATYPAKRFLPDWNKYGIKGKTYGSNPFNFFRKIICNSKAETLLKVGQFNILEYMMNGYDYKISNHWSSVKICIRNKYKVKDASMWFDYLELLERFRKDLHSAHYVCPVDLKAVHDTLMDKRRKEQERAEKERNIKKLLEMKKYEEEFINLKSKFFDLKISDGKITIVPLKSLEEFMQEGTTMHHCVFTNGYYKDPDSLIMSARIGDKRIETIEVNLKEFNVVQSRGVCNSNTEYHEKIVGLVKKNINLIRQKMTA